MACVIFVESELITEPLFVTGELITESVFVIGEICNG